jgi:hypothetical protein
MSNVHVFVSFDLENDAELYEQLLEQSENSGSGFAVSGKSERPTAANASSEKERRRIREADQVIIICGEHTESSVRVSVELGIAQQEGTPYFLLWGRRDLMCTKPVGAKSAEGMYSWTKQILDDQIAYTIRKARSDATARTLRTVRPKSGSSQSPSQVSRS